MQNAMITLLELAIGATIVFGFIYEKKLIAFEDTLKFYANLFLDWVCYSFQTRLRKNRKVDETGLM